MWLSIGLLPLRAVTWDRFYFAQTGGEESVTSSEFERFLAERAAAAEQLPTVTGSTNDATRSRNTPAKDEKSLFAL
jgi:hypothetical protein